MCPALKFQQTFPVSFFGSMDGTMEHTKSNSFYPASVGIPSSPTAQPTAVAESASVRLPMRSTPAGTLRSSIFSADLKRTALAAPRDLQVIHLNVDS